MCVLRQELCNVLRVPPHFFVKRHVYEKRSLFPNIIKCVISSRFRETHFCARPIRSANFSLWFFSDNRRMCAIASRWHSWSSTTACLSEGGSVGDQYDIESSDIPAAFSASSSSFPG